MRLSNNEVFGSERAKYFNYIVFLHYNFEIRMKYRQNNFNRNNKELYTTRDRRVV